MKVQQGIQVGGPTGCPPGGLWNESYVKKCHRTIRRWGSLSRAGHVLGLSHVLGLPGCIVGYLGIHQAVVGLFGL